jgi:hypothetical protein
MITLDYEFFMNVDNYLLFYFHKKFIKKPYNKLLFFKDNYYESL